MTSQDIERGNCAIAAFMKWVKDPWDKWRRPAYGDSWNAPDGDYPSGSTYKDSELEYHSNWSWLMPVVEKIESVGYRTCIDGGDKQFGNYCHIKKWTNDNELKHFIKEGQKDKIVSQQSTKINTVYPAVLQFLEWYNSQQVK